MRGLLRNPFGAKLFYLFAFAILAALITPNSAVAQLEDPLKKPDIWKKILLKPYDSVLWANYMGKSWAAMNAQEYSQIYKWKQALSVQTIDEPKMEDFKIAPVAGGSADEDFMSDNFWGTPEESVRKQKEYDEKVKEREAVYVKELEQAIMEDKKSLEELKANINENFVFIEELYEDEFKELGGEYKWYKEVYPDGKYNQSQWVEDQEKQLKDLKRKHFIKTKLNLTTKKDY